MNKYLAGILYIDDEEEKYYTDDFKIFQRDTDETVGKCDLQQWALCANSPWSQENIHYILSYNCEDGKEITWKCEYSVASYDGIFASVFGYGNTEMEALEDCIKHFQALQSEYNVDNKSF